MGRFLHGSISAGNQIMVIGGGNDVWGDSVKTEVWTLEKSGNMIKSDQDNPMFDNYQEGKIVGWGVGLYLVPKEYCQGKKSFI